MEAASRRMPNAIFDHLRNIRLHLSKPAGGLEYLGHFA